MTDVHRNVRDRDRRQAVGDPWANVAPYKDIRDHTDRIDDTAPLHRVQRDLDAFFHLLQRPADVLYRKFLSLLILFLRDL